MASSLMNKAAAWLAADGPEPAMVVGTCGRLIRNLADFPFPQRCSAEDRAAVEQRVVGALESLGFLGRGQYYAAANLAPRELRFLGERILIGRDFAPGKKSCGVYVADDQCMSVLVNGTEHVAVRALASGLQIKEVWSRLNAVDDKLAGMLGYAFSPDLGYLSSNLRTLGTGLRITAVAHVPALFEVNKVGAAKEQLCGQRYAFQDFYDAADGEESDFVRLANASTLGQSEEEIVFHLKHLVSEVISWEKDARNALVHDAPRSLEDRVYRAVGVAREARLLDFPEAVRLVSSLRLGIGCGLFADYSFECINRLHMDAHRGHIEMRLGQDCDDLTLNSERADLFRERLA
ncbi:MAG TPA: hypothetical protein HPP77_04825 [Candidatus Hydrogenedentes bacterium]|nr:hypothetical protein [Candidatus Hydrogenedentota bacterium]